ncbi:MAG TPA: hypothetical protein VEW47_04825 [Candidatus Dormibacteraeota bacterium]|nr:hypothetical protein [Candidatus Dormibacteraeota bacterium]
MKLMLKWVTIGALLATGVGSVWAADLQQVPQTPSLEGISIGMSLTDLAGISGIDLGREREITDRFLRRADIFDLSPGYLGCKIHHFTLSDRRGWVVEDAKGQIVWLRMVYVVTSGALSLRFSADPEPNAMIRLLTERWGAPASTTLSQNELHNGFNATVAREHLTTVTWQAGNIRAVYTVGRALIDPEKHPVIVGLIQDMGDRPETYRADVTIFNSVAREAADAAHDDAALDDAKDKVKF